jgi:hypothetical protein
MTDIIKFVPLMFLLQTNCLVITVKKLKEMGDINKYPGGKFKVPSNQFNSGNVPFSVGASFNSGGFRPGNLNFRGGRGQTSRRPRLMIPPQYPSRS